MERDPQEQADLYSRWVGRTMLSDQTAQVYEARVRAFTDWLAENGSQYGGALTDEHVRDYAVRDWRRKLLTVDKRATSTVAQHMSALRSFYEWLELGAPRGVSVDVIQADRHGLKDDQLRWVLRSAQRQGPREFALVATLSLVGARVSEAVGIDTDDIGPMTERSGEVMIGYGKGGRPRKVPLGPQARSALKGWLAERRTWAGADTPGLFLSRAGDRLGPRQMQRLVVTIGDTAGVKISPHVLRHTYGRRSVEHGTDLETLRRMMGHKSIQTTAGYTKPTHQDMQDAADRLDVDL